MPFTIDGKWIPSPHRSTTARKPVKVRLVKRGRSILTVVLNLSMSPSELETLASRIKKKLGCGGAVKQSDLEIQGDHVQSIIRFLGELGIIPK